MEKYKNSFLRGDLNASRKNHSRATVLAAVIDRLGLTRVSIPHKTYHHFTCRVDSDSDMDIILYSDDVNVSKHMNEVICELEHLHFTSDQDGVSILPLRESQTLDFHIIGVRRACLNIDGL